ncbi:sugar-binding protein [Leptospira ellisii]|uniref:Sugar-binding protein n=1 Tax=Leptospira ellisii TaxID=2023197 RepID=A0A2N0BDX6_9LEPT|nr:sugar-binding protein [Leptospira ellisii]MDV6235497.1 sugar-binding protein [Leptospira ellisii]PJZ94762.1 hypothetical protein CH379_01085 [Leptospira ellisii]
MTRIDKSKHALLFALTFLAIGVLFSQENTIDLKAIEKKISERLGEKGIAFPFELGKGEESCGSDFDSDGIQDFASTVRFTGSPKDESENFRDQDGFLSLFFGDGKRGIRSDVLLPIVPCDSCGGVYGRPEVALQCKGATVKVQSYGGSNWRWANSEILRWKSGNWQWIGSDSYSYHTYFGDGIKTSLNRINLDANREYEGRSNPEIPELPSRGPIRFKKIVSFRSNGDSEKDSKEEDTPALPFSIETPDWISDKKPDWKGAADLSFKIASRWDPQRLFLNVEVADDSILACSEGKTDCDSIEIILDSDPSLLDIGPDGGLRKTPGKRWAKIVLPVRNEEGKWKFDAKSSAKDRINVKFVKTKSGYTISCGIPWSRWIENPRTNPPRVGSVFLATVSVLDFDFPGDKGKTMSSSEIRGKDPFTFGELELSEKPYSLGGYRKGE